jgi:hypothetical protein
MNLTVQQQPLPPAINSYPLPTAYWTRPIEGQNTYWYTIASNWLGAWSSAQFGTFQQQYMNLWQQVGSAPNTPHIMWTKPLIFGGVVGGSNTQYDGAIFSQFAASISNNMIIMNGYLYYQTPSPNSLNSATPQLGTVNVGPFCCVDLRTGQTIWQNYNINPTWGEILSYYTTGHSGPDSMGFLWQSYTNAAGVTTWMCYDALNGDWVFNVTNIPTGTLVSDSMGNLDIYVLNYNVAKETGWLGLWNLTDVISRGISLWNGGTFAPAGQVFNGNIPGDYSWNVTISSDLTGLALNNTAPTGVSIGGPSIYAILPGDIMTGSIGTVTYTTSLVASAPVIAATGTSLAIGVEDQYTPNPYTMWALNLNASVGPIGSLLWIKNYTAPDLIAGNPNLSSDTMRYGPVDPVANVITLNCGETFQWYGYSLTTGNLLWGPTDTPPPSGFQYFGGGQGLGQWATTAYGNFYTQGYGGVIYCYNSETGKLVWTFGNGGPGNSTNDGLNSNWGLLPIFIAGISDGMVYAFNNQHSTGGQNPPYKGYMIYCLNATTGQEIWTGMGGAGEYGGPGESTAAIADGFLAYWNYYDNSMYVVGRGPSATTVQAPLAAITVGTPVVIQGTVTDISAGTTQTEQAADFPHGVPCASDASMNAWMEYVYMQKPEPTNFTGVTVTLTAIDPNHNFITLGTATTDSNGLYTFTWTPPSVSGSYLITATFAGTNGYWGSNAQTGMVVQNAPSVTPTAAPVSGLATMSALTIGIVAAVIAIIIAIAIVGLLLMRKKP